MSDAAAYLKRGRQIQSQKFGRAGVARDDGSASEGGEGDRAQSRPSGVDSIVILPLHDAQHETHQLPMKKKKKKSASKKRRRGDSDSDSDEAETTVTVLATSKGAPAPSAVRDEEKVSASCAPAEASASTADDLELANVASPSSPLPPVENVAQRISLLSKWFPAALQESKMDPAVAPGSDFVAATVERMAKARDYVLSLRYGIEDLEALLKESRELQPRLWAVDEGDKSGGRRQHYWQLSGSAVAGVVRASGTAPYKEALAELSNDVPTTSRAVAAAVRAAVHRRRRLRVPLDYRPKAWHDLLDTRGPEAGYVLRLSDILWLSVASATALFSVVAQRLLRSARALAERRAGENGAAVPQRDTEVVADDGEGEEDSADGASAKDKASKRPIFFDNADENSFSDDAEEPDEVSLWIAEPPFAFSPALSANEKSLLAFLRYVMPVQEGDGSADGRVSTGYGVWLYAAFTTLDTPLDPDTARLAHDLFRTCCRHLRTLAAWKNVQGSARNSLLKEFAPRPKGTKASYGSLDDIAREDVLALYTFVVVLSRFFQQNQDHFIPL